MPAAEARTEPESWTIYVCEHGKVEGVFCDECQTTIRIKATSRSVEVIPRATPSELPTEARAEPESWTIWIHPSPNFPDPHLAPASSQRWELELLREKGWEPVEVIPRATALQERDAALERVERVQAELNDERKGRAADFAAFRKHLDAAEAHAHTLDATEIMQPCTNERTYR